MIKLFSNQVNRPNLKALFDEFNAAHFENMIPEIELEWNTRRRTVAGMCYYVYKYDPKTFQRIIIPTKIEMSDALFAEFNYDITKVRSTFLHEMCHAYCNIKYHETGHGPWFQYTMTKVTGIAKNHRCHNYDISALRNEKHTLVSVFCQTCQKEIGTKPKMPAEKVLARGFTHKGCGGKVVFIKKNIEDEDNGSGFKKLF